MGNGVDVGHGKDLKDEGSDAKAENPGVGPGMVDPQDCVPKDGSGVDLVRRVVRC